VTASASIQPAGAAEACRAELVEDWAGLRSLEPEWNPLLARSRADSIFLTWEWIDAWRQAVGEAVRPFVVALRDGQGRVQAIAPLYLGRLRLLGCLSYRTLRILGDYHSGAEYGDWIVPRDREQLAPVLASALAAARRCWDCIWMPNVAGWTGARERVLGACAASGLRVRDRPRDFSAAGLPDDYASFWKCLSANARSTIQRQARRIDAEGARFETCATGADVDTFLDALVDLNHRRWRSAGGEGTFHRKPLELAFYRHFTRRAFERGWLRIFALRVGDAFKAVQIGYAYGGSFLQLQEGFDPEAAPGLGNVLRSRAIEACIGEGLRSYDFLGEHTDHKRRWLARPRQGYDLLAGLPGAKNALVLSTGVWPTGRFLRPLPIAAPGARVSRP
jgi:CelD/BcsL family acetyltransferase involved in cellulose biosynthesis